MSPAIVISRRKHVFALAIIVAAFVTLYPYLGAMDVCEHGGCPHAVQSSQSSSAGLAMACVGIALAAASAGLISPAAIRKRRIAANDRRPAQLYLSPDPRPPRLLPTG